MQVIKFLFASFLKMILFVVFFNHNMNGQSICDNLSTETYFQDLVNEEFSKIVTGSNFSNFGNYAAISSDDKSLKASMNFIKKNIVTGLTLSGAASEGVFNVFDSGDLNSSFSGELKIHALKNLKEASIDSYKKEEIIKQCKDFEKLSSKKLEIINNGSNIAEIKVKIYEKEYKIGVLSKGLNKLKEEQDPKVINPGIGKNVDSLKIEILKKDLELKKEINEKRDLENTLIKITAAGYSVEESERIKQEGEKKRKEFIKNLHDIPLESFDIKWSSLGMKANKNSFKYVLPPTVLIDTFYTSFKLTGSLSRLKSSYFENQDEYWSIGASISYLDNFTDLKKISIEENTPIEGSNQTVVKTISAYKGDYITGIWGLSIFYDYIKFLGSNKSNIGIHFNPDFSINNYIKKPLFNFYLGFLIPFMVQDKQESKVNLEVFYRKADVFNYVSKANKNNSVGIKATFPIKLIFNKK